MAKVFPFRGFRYDKEKAGDISAVIAEPYDKITPELQETYYARHPHNIVRFSKGKTEPGDTPDDNQYTRANEYLEKWIASGILKRDEKPAIYVYNQEYSVGGGPRKTRHAFIALGQLEEFGEGGVKPHERTLAGPKADRLNLMRATAAQAGLIFMLYSDPENEITGILSKAANREPEMEAKDDNGVIHRIWAVTDPSLHARVAGLMEEKTLFIADGHHRYETALNYRREMKEKKAACGAGSENYDNHIMAFVSMQDSGLTILPTHRLIFNLTAEQTASLLNRLGEFFALQPCDNLDALLTKMKAAGEKDHAFGLYMDKKFALLSLKSEEKAFEIMSPGASDDWKRLDVSIIHAILEKTLGIDKKKLEQETNVAYERYPDLAVKEVDSGRCQCVIFLNPTKGRQVAEVAGNGERMPQKSTDFYPKLYTGLVLNKLNLLMK